MLTTSGRLAAGWTVLVTALLLSLFAGRGFDDPYITYRYAANLAAGHGFVYNLGEQVLSTTTPLYTLLLAAVKLLGADLPLASSIISCVSLGIGGLAFWGLGRVWDSTIVGVAGLVLFPTFPLLGVTIGAETALYSALILLGFLAYSRNRYSIAVSLIALATLTRADGILGGVAIAAHFFGWRRSQVPWRASLPFLLLLVPWFAFSWLYFGALFPLTLAAKQHQAQLAHGRTFLEGVFPVVTTYLGQSLYRLHYGLAMIGLGALIFRPNRFALVVGWSGLYFVAYSALGVSSYFWYYAPLVPGFLALVGLGVDAVWRLTIRSAGRNAGCAVAVGLVCLLLVPQMRSLWSLHMYPDRRYSVYREAGEWLNRNTKPEESVGTVEVGIIGYYAGRRIIDFAGLIQPEVMLQLQPGTTYEDAAIWAVRQFRPNYLVLHDGIFPRLEQDPAMMTACRSVQTFSDANYAQRLVVYRCRW